MQFKSDKSSSRNLLDTPKIKRKKASQICDLSKLEISSVDSDGFDQNYEIEIARDDKDLVLLEQLDLEALDLSMIEADNDLTLESLSLEESSGDDKLEEMEFEDSKSFLNRCQTIEDFSDQE